MLTDTWETAACPPKDHSVGEAAGACEADQSPPSSEATPPPPPTCLQGAFRENFTLAFSVKLRGPARIHKHPALPTAWRNAQQQLERVQCDCPLPNNTATDMYVISAGYIGYVQSEQLLSVAS